MVTTALPDTHFCKDCQATLPGAMFYVRHDGKDGAPRYVNFCKRCYNTRNERARKKLFYGMSPQEYGIILYGIQDGGCAICGRETDADVRRQALSVDHNHKTGDVRGILCSSCNKGIGHFFDSPENLRRAADYLELYQR